MQIAHLCCLCYTKQWLLIGSLLTDTLCLIKCVCVCVVCQKMFFRPADVTRPVWESSSPLSPLLCSTSSLAYISSINPVLGVLLWSLCVLWAMVIICLLCSHCFMRLVCLLPFFSPFSRYILLTCTVSLLLCCSASMSFLSLSLPLLVYSTYYFFLNFSSLQTPASHLVCCLCFLSLCTRLSHFTKILRRWPEQRKRHSGRKLYGQSRQRLSCLAKVLGCIWRVLSFFKLPQEHCTNC